MTCTVHTCTNILLAHIIPRTTPYCIPVMSKFKERLLERPKTFPAEMATWYDPAVRLSKTCLCRPNLSVLLTLILLITKPVSSSERVTSCKTAGTSDPVCLLGPGTQETVTELGDVTATINALGAMGTSKETGRLRDTQAIHVTIYLSWDVRTYVLMYCRNQLIPLHPLPMHE